MYFLFFKGDLFSQIKKKLKRAPSAQRCPKHSSILTYAWPYPYQLPAEITVPQFRDVHQHMVLVLGTLYWGAQRAQIICGFEQYLGKNISL